MGKDILLTNGAEITGYSYGKKINTYYYFTLYAKINLRFIGLILMTKTIKLLRISKHSRPFS